MGPESIESHYDEALAVPGRADGDRGGRAGGADGHVIACFGDPGLDAARELATGPVVGIAEAAMHAAALLGRGFSVVTTLSRTRARPGTCPARTASRGAAGGCTPATSRCSTSKPRRPGFVAKACAAARDFRIRCDMLVLGCAAMSGLAEITDRLGVPVVDRAGRRSNLEALVSPCLRTSKRDEYGSFPRAKPVLGPLSGLAVRGPACR